MIGRITDFLASRKPRREKDTCRALFASTLIISVSTTKMTNRKNRLIIIRVDNEQHARIFNNAKAKGFSTVSSYLRTLALEYNLASDFKIQENNKLLKEIITLIKGNETLRNSSDHST